MSNQSSSLMEAADAPLPPPMGKLEIAVYELGYLLSCERHGHLIGREAKHMQEKASRMLEVERQLSQAMADHSSAAMEMGVGL